MADKDKQLDLNLGEVEYITDPNFVPERLVDKVGIDNLTEEHFYELVSPVMELGHHYIDYGDYEGETVWIFDSWEAVSEVLGIINGYENLGDDPMIFRNETLQDKLAELVKQYNETDPEHYGTKSRLERAINDCQSWIDFETFLSHNEYEKVSFEDFGITWGFTDSYSRCACGNCSNIVETQADHYGWTPPLDLGEGYISDDCVSDGSYDEEILDYYANEQKSIPTVRSPEDLGLVKINEDSYQNGMHYGMDDTPEPIIENLNNQDIDVWFVVHPSQFYADFDVYVKAEDKDKATAILSGTDTYQGYSTAGNLEKALKSVSLQSTNSEGVNVTTVDVSTGTAKTKVVSNQDFIDGKVFK